ncbi:RWD domain-containing protein 2B [Durusdinium trenchii]|uniref:RWD domain-containing protein 2B n=1 Tax=Durusdinium trenchii TaxID=1381693 RepID=A0ABP0JWA9_9DINO
MDDTWLSRQLLEMESLSAIYCEEGDLRVDEEALEALGAAAKDVEASLSRLPALSLSVRVFTDDAVAAGSVRLAAVLPHGYPTTAAPMVWLEPEVEASTSSRFLQVADDDNLGQRLQEAALHWGQKGEECLLPLIQTAEELIRTWADDLAVAMAVQEELEEQEEVPTLAPPCTRVLRARGALGRRAMFSHHIIAPGKRQVIKDWAAQLQLGGMAKVGWPGVIIVEGEEPNVVAYVEALSRLRWKHFVVRAEQMIELDGMPLDSLRVLPVPLEEFPPDGMSEFSARCRHLGVEELFLAALKIGDKAASKKGKKR